MDFVNASRGFSADLLGLSQAASILLSLHTRQFAPPQTDPLPLGLLGPVHLCPEDSSSHSCRPKPSDHFHPKVSLYYSRKTKDIARNLEVFGIE